MSKLYFFGGGKSEYLAPNIRITDVRIEHGFSVSLPSLDTEEGESWETVSCKSNN